MNAKEIDNIDLSHLSQREINTLGNFAITMGITIEQAAYDILEEYEQDRSDEEQAEKERQEEQARIDRQQAVSDLKYVK